MVEKESVRRGYDDLAASYARYRGDDGPGMELLGSFLDSLSDPARLLDAGCGQGSPVLSELCEFAPAVGLDISRTQLELAGENAPSARRLQGDLANLPFREGSFDAVTAFHSLIHVPKGQHRTVVHEFARVLRPGGRVLLTEGTGEWTGTNPDWLDTGVEMQWHIAGADETRSQLRRAGFTLQAERVLPETAEGSDDGWTYFVARLEP